MSEWCIVAACIVYTLISNTLESSKFDYLGSYLLTIVGSKYAQYWIDSGFSPISLACLKRATSLPTL